MKRNLIGIAALVVLVGVYVVFFTDWLKPKKIEIFHTSRSSQTFRVGPRVKAGAENTRVIQFGLSGTFRLTEIKVVALEQWKTNRFTLPVWHLVSDSNSIPIKTFPYGQNIRGMKPAVGSIWPKPLETNMTYRIFISAGSIKGEHDFTTIPK